MDKDVQTLKQIDGTEPFLSLRILDIPCVEAALRSVEEYERKKRGDDFSPTGGSLRFVCCRYPTIGDLLERVRSLRIIRCNKRHDNRDDPKRIAFTRCPMKPGNMVCGHIAGPRGTGLAIELETMLWFAQKSGAMEERRAQELEQRLSQNAGQGGLLGLDLGMQYASSGGNRNSEDAGWRDTEIHPTLVQLGVTSLQYRNQPPLENVIAAIDQEEENIGNDMAVLKGELAAAFEMIAREGIPQKPVQASTPAASPEQVCSTHSGSVLKRLKSLFGL